MVTSKVGTGHVACALLLCMLLLATPQHPLALASRLTPSRADSSGGVEGSESLRVLEEQREEGKVEGPPEEGLNNSTAGLALESSLHPGPAIAATLTNNSSTQELALGAGRRGAGNLGDSRDGDDDEQAIDGDKLVNDRLAHKKGFSISKERKPPRTDEVQQDLELHDLEQPWIGKPTQSLKPSCRRELAGMFAQGALCPADRISKLCTADADVLLEWRLLCLSGLFINKAEDIFQPWADGNQVPLWGSPYSELLGTVAGRMEAATENREQSRVFEEVKGSAALGPVLAAIVEKREQHALGMLLAWTMSITEMMHPLCRTMMSKLVLGGVALERAGIPFSLDNVLQKYDINADDAGRQLRVEASDQQFVVMLNRVNAAKGSGFNRKFELLGMLLPWSASPLPNIAFQATETSPNAFFSCDSKTIATNLQLSGSGGYDGFGLSVSASASYASSGSSNSSSCIASLSKRVYDLIDQVNALEMADMPLLSDATLKYLQTYGEAMFEKRYGAYFVLATTKYSRFEGKCTIRTTALSSDVSVAANLSASGWGFSASMNASFAKAKADGSITFSCSTYGACGSIDASNVTGIYACASLVNIKTPRSENDRVILMRFSDLANYNATLLGPASLSTPFDLLGDQLQLDMSTAWTRAMFLHSTLEKRLNDPEQRQFRQNLQRIMNTISALAAKKPLPSNGSLVVLYDKTEFEAGSELTRLNYTSDSGRVQNMRLSDNGNLNDKLTSATVGEGLLITLYENSMIGNTPPGGASLHWGTGSILDLNYLGFNDQTSLVVVESIASLTTSRIQSVVTTLRRDLDNAENQWNWAGYSNASTTAAGSIVYSSGLFGSYDMACQPNEVLQGFKYVRLSGSLYWSGVFQYRCAPLSSVIRTKLQMQPTVSGPEQYFSSLMYLDRHNFTCNGPAGGMLNRIRIWAPNTWRSQVEYNCIQSTPATPDLSNCRVLTTTPEFDGTGYSTWAFLYLDRHEVRCNAHERLTDVRFLNAGTQWSAIENSNLPCFYIRYMCCGRPQL